MNVSQRKALMKAVEDLNNMQAGDDAECRHGEAENILCNLLKQVGYGEAAEAFDNAADRVGFWYA